MAALLAYGLTACRDLAWGDAVEFTLGASVLGVPHPTGYPLYMLLARLAAAVPLGALAWRVNVLSGGAAALAIGGAYLVARRLGCGRAAATTSALAVLAAREVWLQATVAEVYTLHLLLVTLLLLTLCTWLREGASRHLALAALIVGLATAHHLTIIAAAPAALWLVFAARRRPPLSLALLALLPLTLYLVLVVRSHADPLLDQGDPESLGALLTHLSGRQFRYRLFTSTPGYMLGELGTIARLLAAQWTWLALPVAAIGLARLGRRHRRELVALLLLGVSVTLYAAGYNIPDKEGYLLPVILVLALLLGAGVEQLLDGLRPRTARRAAAVILALLPLAAMPLHLADADRHDDRSLRDLTLAAFSRTAPGSVVLTDDTNTYFALLQLQSHEHRLADRHVVLTYLLPMPWYLPTRATHLPALELPALEAAVQRREVAARDLDGSLLGRQRARDQQELAALLARHLLPGHRVYLYRHDFEEQLDGWQGLATRDLGLIDELFVDPSGATVTDTVSLAFPRAEHYTTTARHLAGEVAVAKRYATAANREGIRRVHLGLARAAERAFRQAIVHDAGYAQPWRNLGLLAADFLGEPEVARHAWQRYLELETEVGAAAAVRRRLETLPADRHATP